MAQEAQTGLSYPASLAHPGKDSANLAASEKQEASIAVVEPLHAPFAGHESLAGAWREGRGILELHMRVWCTADWSGCRCMS